MRAPVTVLRALLPLPVELDDDEAEGGEQEHARPPGSCGPGRRASELPIVATSTIEPRLPSIGMAFIRTPPALSAGPRSRGWPEHDLAVGRLEARGVEAPRRRVHAASRRLDVG